jgi:NADH dehydrogenase
VPEQVVTVFGGTGFLGRRIVRHLHDSGFAVRIATRHPDRAHLPAPGDGSVVSLRADVKDDGPVASAVSGAWAVVNAVSLYVERGKDTFQAVHVRAAERVAKLGRQAGIERLVHISGIGSDARSTSPYVRSRGEGEAAVLDAFPSATLIRPAVMFGPGDAFVTPLLVMIRQMPAFPMFGTGKTRLQPVYVEDVAEAIDRTLQLPTAHPLYELAGPNIYTYEELLRTLAAALGRRPLLLPFPFALWHVVGYLSEFLPNPPITRNQVELMGMDNVAASASAGFEALRITPQRIENILPQIVQTTAEASGS